MKKSKSIKTSCLTNNIIVILLYLNKKQHVIRLKEDIVALMNILFCSATFDPLLVPC